MCGGNLLTARRDGCQQEQPARAETSTEHYPRQQRTRSTTGPSLGRRTSGSIEKPGEAARALLLVSSDASPRLTQVAKSGTDELAHKPDTDRPAHGLGVISLAACLTC